jgi:hypothetical protein
LPPREWRKQWVNLSQSAPLVRGALIVLLLGSVALQIVVPVIASGVGTRFPEVAHLVIPYSVAAILFIGCGQVALFAVWRLVPAADRQGSVTRSAVRSVNVIAACATVATGLSVGVLIHMLASVPGGGGPAIYYLAACVIGGAAVLLRTAVMRARLRRAAAVTGEDDALSLVELG